MQQPRQLFIIFSVIFFSGILGIRFLVPEPIDWFIVWTAIYVSLNLVLLWGKKFKNTVNKPNTNVTVDKVSTSQTLISAVFFQLDQMVMVIDQESKIILTTQPWIKIFGANEGLLINLKSFRDAATLWSTINQSLATERMLQCEWEFQQRTYHSNVSPLNIDGSFYGVLVTATDITKINQLEKIQSDFLADISHEIKTPLAAILGASEILTQTERKLTNKETKEFQTMIASESSRLQRLIHELTDLSKIGSHGFQTLIKTTFYLNEFMMEICKIYQLELEKKQINLRINIPNELVAFADKDKFALIFTNLMSNAIRYTDQGSITIRGEVINQTLVIEIADTGLGIEPQNLERIFDRFYRTDIARTRHGGGTGLGLAITRAIIQAHQGTIQVKSEVKKGTTFTMTLPHPLLT